MCGLWRIWSWCPEMHFWCGFVVAVDGFGDEEWEVGGGGGTEAAWGM